MDDSERDNGTPPHHPTHGVHLSNETLSAIVHCSLPHPPIKFTVSQLPHGMSFNNRIYLIDSEDSPGTSRSYILKVNGKFFGPGKVENEVSCLLLLNHFCPDVPVPRLIAWTTNGSDVVRFDTSKGRAAITTTYLFEQDKISGWILMTRLPGSPVDPSRLSSQKMSDLSKQLAQIVLSWQQHIPKSTYCGNLQFSANTDVETAYRLYKLDASTGPDFHVCGLLGLGIDSSPSIDSLLSYWQTKLSHSIRELSTKSPFAANRAPNLPQLQEFVHSSLPSLFVFREECEGFTFVHTDLAPQNVLVSGDPPTITGIIDFEFSGFFPSIEEFVPEWVAHEKGSGGDWPTYLYKTMLQELEGSGILTPLRLQSSNTNAWKELKCLSRLETYIAPWWLAEGGVEGPELVKELAVARAEVENAILDLRQMGTSNSYG